MYSKIQQNNKYVFKRQSVYSANVRVDTATGAFRFRQYFGFSSILDPTNVWVYTIWRIA